METWELGDIKFQISSDCNRNYICIHCVTWSDGSDSLRSSDDIARAFIDYGYKPPSHFKKHVDMGTGMDSWITRSDYNKLKEPMQTISIKN